MAQISELTGEDLAIQKPKNSFQNNRDENYTPRANTSSSES